MKQDKQIPKQKHTNVVTEIKKLQENSASPTEKSEETVLFQFAYLKLRFPSAQWTGSSFNTQLPGCPDCFLVKRGELLLIKIGTGIYTPYHNALEFSIKA